MRRLFVLLLAACAAAVFLELYAAAPENDARLINASTRAPVGCGAGSLVAGFGVTGTLADPKLEIFAAGAPTLVTSFATVGAFPLPNIASRDAVLLTSLPPGNYSAQVTGVSGSTGEVLLELYQHP